MDFSTLTVKTRLHAANLLEIVTNRHSSRSSTIRRYAFDAARGVTTGVLASVPPYTFLVRTQDKSLGRQTFSHGAYELDVMSKAIELLQGILKTDFQGKVFVDVGANIGTTSIPALLKWKFTTSLSIEPSPDNFKLLRCNAILNDLDNRLISINAAVGTQVGEVELELSPTNSGDHRVRVVHLANTSTDGDEYDEKSRQTVKVPCVPLDSILEERNIPAARVGLLWIDTQGFEGHVLASASKLLASGVPTIIEYWPYGLRRTGALNILHDTIRTFYSELWDIRTGERYTPDDAISLERAYVGTDYTDLLLIPTKEATS